MEIMQRLQEGRLEMWRMLSQIMNISIRKAQCAKMSYLLTDGIKKSAGILFTAHNQFIAHRHIRIKMVYRLHHIDFISIKIEQATNDVGRKQAWIHDCRPSVHFGC
ncbi:Uncharacterised protein [Vibrio cholerae]|uniref:Uncharacterized protein n=1 Tax=Vibrio cholerae TaxID=666 RepID=A0A655WRU6_VIBCL|nr:Uncharacterised protein [Vibrio cholerae]